MIWLILLISFFQLGRVAPVFGQETKGILVKYKDGKIKELDNSSKLYTLMSETGENSVLYTQPNYQYKQYEIGNKNIEKLNLNKESLVKANYQYVQNQITETDRKWFLDNNGQVIFTDGNNIKVSGMIGADLGYLKSRELLSGVSKQDVIVAVIDSGVDYNHSYLSNKMWNGSGCVDEYGSYLGNCQGGYDFVDEDKDPMPDSTLQLEVYTHGTHIAGIISMITDNVKIMALKTDLTSSQITRAILFARNNGAKVINASWGSSYEDGAYPSVNDRAMYEAIADYNGVFVNAAGNDSIGHDCGSNSCIPFPAVLKNSTSMGKGLQNIIVVGASDYYDDLARFSNFGKTNVDLAAPGVTIYSTVNGNGYDYYSGTSMATPTVAGVIASIWGWKSSLNRSQMMDYVVNSGQKLDSMLGLVTSGRRLDMENTIRRINGVEWDFPSIKEEGVVLRDGDIGNRVSMFVDSSDVPAFVYYNLSTNKIEFYKNGNKREIATGDSYISISKDSNDNPIIYLDNLEQIKIIKCADKDCVTRSNYSYSGLNAYFGKIIHPDIMLDSNNRLVVLAQTTEGNDLLLLRCLDENCKTVSSTKYNINTLSIYDWCLTENNGQVEPVFHTGQGLKITDKKGLDYYVGFGEHGIVVNQKYVVLKYGFGPYMSIDKLSKGGIGIAFYDSIAGDLRYVAYGESKPCVQSADYNKDGLINGADYVVWRNVFVDKMSNENYFADGNCDGKVTTADYSFWREQYLLK